jgi:hypothetical protein
LGLFILVIAVMVFNALNKPPSCFDGKQNQDERGVDCGGVCELLCREDIQELNVLWTSAYEISPNVLSVAAYIQHTNAEAYTAAAPYRFQFYNRRGTLLGEREGTTFVSGDPTFVIVESKIDVGDEVISRTVFEWTDEPTWRHRPPILGVVVEEREVLKLPFGVEVRAWLHNKQPLAVEDVEVVLVVYDENQTAIAVSSTYVEYVGPRDAVPISFAWPSDFDVFPIRYEFVARVEQSL